MFTRRVNLIESDEGFSVEVLGRTGIRYTEHGRSMLIDSEVLTTANIAVYPKRMRWDGARAAHITAEERDRIIGNVRRAIRFAGHDIELPGAQDVPELHRKDD